MDPRVAALLSYVLGFLTGLIFFLIERESTFVKFHALQSILFSLTLMGIAVVVTVIPGIGFALGGLVNLAGVVLWAILLIKSYEGEWFKLPVIGDIATKKVGAPPS